MALWLARAAINLLAVVLTVAALFAFIMAMVPFDQAFSSLPEGAQDGLAAGMSGGVLFLCLVLFYRLRGALTRRLLSRATP